MKEQYIKDLREQDIVSTSFLVKAVNKQFKKDQSPYLSLVLGDNSGDIEGKIWDEVPRYEQLFQVKDFVKINARVNRFKDKLQLQINDLYRLPKDVIELSDYLPASPNDPEKQWQAVVGLLRGIKQPQLKKLLETWQNDKQFVADFKRAPAAKQIHHAYVGGLLDHTLSMMQLADQLAKHYPFLNRDLLLTGTFIHDLGKIKELEFESAFDYSQDGKLVGHLVQGCFLLEEKIQTLPNFPNDLAAVLKHFIISHHGQIEFGAVRLPQTVEALALHYIDLIDSKLESVRPLLAQLEDSGQPWTAYQRQLERSFYRWSDEKQKAQEPNKKKNPATTKLGELELFK